MKKNKKLITKDMSLAEVLEICPESQEVLLEIGLPCMGCPAARMETVEQGCIVHGIDPDKFIEELNKRCKKSAK